MSNVMRNLSWAKLLAGALSIHQLMAYDMVSGISIPIPLPVVRHATQLTVTPHYAM